MWLLWIKMFILLSWISKRIGRNIRRMMIYIIHIWLFMIFFDVLLDAFSWRIWFLGRLRIFLDLLLERLPTFQLGGHVPTLSSSYLLLDIFWSESSALVPLSNLLDGLFIKSSVHIKIKLFSSLDVNLFKSRVSNSFSPFLSVYFNQHDKIKMLIFK